MARIHCLIPILWISIAGYGQTDNKTAMALFNNGCYQVLKKNYERAIFDFTEAIKLDSGFIQAYENRGVAKFYLHDYLGAVDDYDIALEINPQDFNTYGRRGWAKFHLLDLRGSIDDFDKAIEGNSNEPSFYNFRGQVKYNLKDYNGAIADFDRVIKSWYSGKYEKSNAFFWRGIVKIDMGQRESGCQDLIRAGKLGNPKALQVAEGFCK